MLPESGTASGSPNPPANSAGVNPRGSSNSAKRVAAGLGDEPLANPHVQRSGEHRVQQRARVALAQALDHQLRQSRQLIARFAGREDQANRFRLHAARDEREDLRRGTIEPLFVIDQADQRPLLSHIR